MGLFTSLFSQKGREQPSGRNEIVLLASSAKFDVEVAADEGHQAALDAICGTRRSRGVNRFETACLILDDRNRRDANAVRVEIRGKQVGYLNGESAVRYRQYLQSRGMPRAKGQCQAVIRGGWVSSDGREGPYTVFLDLPAFSL